MIKISSILNPKKLNDVIISLTLMTPAILVFFRSAFLVESNIASSFIAVALMVLLLLYCFSRPKNRIKASSIFLAVSLFLVLAASLFFYTGVDYSLAQFGFYILVPLLVSQQEFNIQNILKNIMVLSIPLFFATDSMLELENVGLNQADMYSTYSFIPSIIATFIYIIYYRKKLDKFTILGCLLNIYYCVRVALTATRGFWLVVAVFIFFVILLYIKQKANKKTYLLVAILLFSVLTTIMLNASSIISAVSNIIGDNAGGQAGIFIKTKHLSESSDILNGRAELWSQSIEWISKNPIFGNGFGSTARLYGNELYLYPHNLFLQLMQDCGLIIAAYPMFIIIYAIVSLTKKGKQTEAQNITVLFLVSITIPILFFSNDIWKNSALWLLIGYGIYLRGSKNE